MFEIERKFRLTAGQYDILRSTLTERYGAPKLHHQIDKIFLEPGKSFGAHAKGEPLMRLRDQDGVSIFTYKRTILETGNRIENETVVSNSEAVEAIIKELKWSLAIIIQKDRLEFYSSGMTYALDKLSELKDQFLEIEIVSTQDDTEGESKIFAEARQLGIDPENQIEQKNYASLVWEERQR